MPRDWRRNAFGSLGVEHVEDEVGVGDVVDVREVVALELRPIDSTHSASSGDVAVPRSRTSACAECIGATRGRWMRSAAARCVRCSSSAELRCRSAYRT